MLCHEGCVELIYRVILHITRLEDVYQAICPVSKLHNLMCYM